MTDNFFKTLNDEYQSGHIIVFQSESENVNVATIMHPKELLIYGSGFEIQDENCSIHIVDVGNVDYEEGYGYKIQNIFIDFPEKTVNLC